MFPYFASLGLGNSERYFELWEKKKVFKFCFFSFIYLFISMTCVIFILIQLISLFGDFLSVAMEKGCCFMARSLTCFVDLIHIKWIPNRAVYRTTKQRPWVPGALQFQISFYPLNKPWIYWFTFNVLLGSKEVPSSNSVLIFFFKVNVNYQKLQWICNSLWLAWLF